MGTVVSCSSTGNVGFRESESVLRLAFAAHVPRCGLALRSM